jgi:RNA polymerase sigma-70 factor, ECF subfamily
MDKITDEQLIRDYLRGDEKSFEFLIQRYLKQIYNFAFYKVGQRQEAEDITQEIFLKVWKNAKKFDCQRNFRAWVFAIANNTCMDFFKKKKPFLFSQIGENGADIIDVICDFSDKSLDFFEKIDAKRAFASILERLSPMNRKIITERYEEGLTFREIAEATGEPLNTIKSRHRRIIASLKETIKK